MKRGPVVLAVAALGVTALAGACSGSTSTSATTTGTSPSPAAPSAITVFAAASLKSAFNELAAQLEKEHPGTRVNFSFAGSSDLVTQLTQGAPADVFASADEANMTKAVDAGLVKDGPVNFATNVLTIVTPPGNPKGVASFADLAKPGTEVVICAPQVPCGSATEKIEKATGVTLSPVSEESAVTDVLGKIISGQADAGLVYVTDAKGAGDEVAAIPFPESGDAVNTYPIAVLKQSANSATAQMFVDLVSGPQGRQVLAEAGFAAP
jgi:molybdate transport system substrate-binding protein